MLDSGPAMSTASSLSLLEWTDSHGGSTETNGGKKR